MQRRTGLRPRNTKQRLVTRSPCPPCKTCPVCPARISSRSVAAWLVAMRKKSPSSRQRGGPLMHTFAFAVPSPTTVPVYPPLLGYIFFKEKLNKKRVFSIILVMFSILYLILVSFKSLPWVGLIVALSWGFYNLLRKKINVDTDVGLLIESLYILPFALGAFYLITINGHNDFQLSDPPLMLFIFIAGPMTVIPLFLYVRGVELCGLGPTGMIFYITPTFQFILGFFYYNELFSITKLVSFILIWIAVFIYLKDLYEND